MHLERQRTLCLHVFLINTKGEKSSTFCSVTVGLQSVTRGFRQLQGVQGVAGGYVWLWFGMVTRGHRLQGVSSGYSGLEVVTGGYKGFQGVTMGSMGLQEVTGGYKGYAGLKEVQGITGGYKGLQMITRGYRDL